MAAHRYWRLNIRATGTADANCSIAEIYGWAAGYSDSQLLGVTVVASNLNVLYPASQCNNGNLADYWYTDVFVNPTTLSFDLGVGVARDIRQIGFYARQDQRYGQCPSAFDWQWSDDNATWTTAFSGVQAAPTGPGVEYISPSPGITVSERTTTFDALIAANFPSIGARVTEATALVPYTSLALAERISGAEAQIAVQSDTRPRVTNAAVLVAVRGRVANPKLRAWTFTLDGHDFYVLRLGIMGTLVYDLYSEQWMDWDAFGQIYWPVNVGINWVDGEGVTDAAGNVFGTNVLVGDDTNPLLYILEPTQPYDQASDPLDPQQQIYFPRVLQGQVQMTGRQTLPCYAVWLTTDMGAPAYVGAGVTLEISDDAGVSYQNMGTVSVTPGVNSPELAWTSLGQIQAPGRLFRITDDGAVARIDAMEMNDPDQK